MATILLTGANGFVGSHVLPELLRCCHRVVALMRSPGTGDQVVAKLTPAERAAADLRIGDVTAPDTVPAAVLGADAVFVGDLARVVGLGLERPEAIGRSYELGNAAA